MERRIGIFGACAALVLGGCGPQKPVVAQDASACGAALEACCNGAACDPGLLCTAGSCQPTPAADAGAACGAALQACCNGAACDPGLSCNAGLCLPSGGQGDAGPGSPDAGTADAGADAGGFDGGPADAGHADAGADAGIPDGGASFDAGAECAGLTGACDAARPCCPGLLCDASGGPTTGTCIAQPADAGPGGIGSPCVTLANCAAGLACAGEPDGGLACATPAAGPSLACVTTGGNCGSLFPQCCGGRCVAGRCAPWTPCGTMGQACGAAGCCAGLACDSDGGTCAPACGAAGTGCVQNADCCADQGLTCLQYQGLSGKLCGYAQYVRVEPDGGLQSVLCKSPSDPTYDPQTDLQCQLGTPCQPATAQGQADPCASAGLVCSFATGVCRQPEEYQPCIPGGPACEPLPDSQTTLQCVDLGESSLCVQPCAIDADCVDPQSTCQAVQGVPGKACLFDFTHPNGCTDYYGACPMENATDGLCFPFVFGEGGAAPQTYGICQQTAPSAGPGAPCLSGGLGLGDFFGGGNRQQGGLCGQGLVCTTSAGSLTGTCAPICDPGTAAAPACAADAGTCLAIWGESLDGYDTGACGVPCDYAAADAGCAAGEKCDPSLLLWGGDSTFGLCVPGAASPIPEGSACDGFAALDACTAGTFCLQDQTGASRCARLCHLGGVGACPAGESCAALGLGGGSTSVYTGACVGTAAPIPDAGTPDAGTADAGSRAGGGGDGGIAPRP